MEFAKEIHWVHYCSHLQFDLSSNQSNPSLLSRIEYGHTWMISFSKLKVKKRTMSSSTSLIKMIFEMSLVSSSIEKSLASSQWNILLKLVHQYLGHGLE